MIFLTGAYSHPGPARAGADIFVADVHARPARKIRVLLLEDRVADAELILRELRRSGFEPECLRVDNEADFVARLAPTIDIILADYTLPQFDGLEALRCLQELKLDIPFIIITGSLGDERAAQCIKEGVSDYLLKDRLERLGLADNECEELSAQYAWMMPERALTQVLCIICARFLRTAWKYQSIAYALTLKEVGVLYESMYLAASAGGLAACAVGTGVGPRFSALIGADPLAESPVGEFIVGRHA